MFKGFGLTGIALEALPCVRSGSQLLRIRHLLHLQKLLGGLVPRPRRSGPLIKPDPKIDLARRW